MTKAPPTKAVVGIHISDGKSSPGGGGEICLLGTRKTPQENSNFPDETGIYLVKSLILESVIS